jgi:hypothetical protein
MAFGQQAGPPASGQQTKLLLQLLQDAGYVGFRDARGPLGFSQRQGGGKFTRDEADAVIAQLQAESEAPDAAGSAPTRQVVRVSAAEMAMAKAPSGQLAAELQRRGWIVIEP